jgi:LCP family protein required for cell wall assembly
MVPERPERPVRHRAVLHAGLILSILLGACGQTPSPTVSAQPQPTTQPTSSPTGQATATPLPTPTANQFDAEMLASRYTVLVIGEDSDLRRESRGQVSRTDTIMVVSLSPRQKRVDMISVPRDTVDIPMANGLLYTGKVNGIAHAYGYDALKGAVETMLAIDIDAYVKVDMDNFAQLVDAVGGVKVVNASWLYDAHLHFSLAPGPVVLGGEAALDYTRTRVDSDYGRAARQQQVLLAMVRKYVNRQADWTIDQLLLMLDSLQTDVDLGNLPTLLEMGRRLRRAEVVSAVLQPPRFSLFAGVEPGTARGWVMIPNLAEMRAYAQDVMGD